MGEVFSCIKPKRGFSFKLEERRTALFLMASQNLINTIQLYERFVERKGISEEVINAYSQAAEVAIRSEKDIEFGLKVSARVKELIDRLVLKLTDGDIWELERYQQDNNTDSYSLLDKQNEILKLESKYTK